MPMLDTATGALVRQITVGQSPQAVAVYVATGRVFVANQQSRSVSVLDARTGHLPRTMPIAGDPTACPWLCALAASSSPTPTPAL